MAITMNYGVRTIEEAVAEYKEEHGKLEACSGYEITYFDGRGSEREFDVELEEGCDPEEFVVEEWNDYRTHDLPADDFEGILSIASY